MFCTESCWANIDYFFRFHIVVWIDWFGVGAFGQTGLQDTANPGRLCLLGPTAEGDRYTGHRPHTGLSTPPRPSLPQQVISSWFAENEPQPSLELIFSSRPWSTGHTTNKRTAKRRETWGLSECWHPRPFSLTSSPRSPSTMAKGGRETVPQSERVLGETLHKPPQPVPQRK